VYGLCNLLEEEVIGNELLLVCLGHALQWVELSLEVTLEGVASLNDLVHDLESLSLGDTWTEWVVSEVSSDSDSSGVDHGLLLGGEVSVLESLSRHVRHVLVLWTVLVVVGNNLIEKLVELGVSVVRSSVDSNT
jgi:hypothetical protein